ncbi:cytochrome P450 [Aspergillus alliaceus]|uniref:cytochrome P450 n=1 Tax=Petromyces alliaceus TaxID=209559 RepID=UPI0012A691F1|nr:cytochrome P450 [Aspergillus alliaceus]KAB8236623.1 cytochrome P450 [Aspergillus alliaceus]
MNCSFNLLIGALLGVGIHRWLFIHGEWHIQAPNILVLHLICFFSLAISVNNAWQSITGYLLALFSSITIYRLYFHRLSHFPGPFWARVTKLWHMWKCRSRRNHFLLADLHRRYGSDFIRTGPSEITVFHPDVFMAIDGPNSKCIKSEWYDLLHPNKALVTARDKETHGSRRRQWNRGFNSKALNHYQERVLPIIDQLDYCIQSDIAAERVSEVTDLFYWLGFDRMGDFIFYETFEMLSDRRWNHVIILLQRALSVLGPLSPVPWLVHIAFKLLPRVWILKDWFDMVAWCESRLRKRRLIHVDPSETPDVAHYLLQDAQESTGQEEWLTGDSILAIVAGSEPTAVALIALFYELGKNPSHADIIHSEVKQVGIRDGREILCQCPHLESAILETLRLYPALPTGGYRKTLQEGITIGGTYIPPETTIVAPRFSISRREDCFEQAEKFIPERWTTRPEMVRNRAAYTPFGTGHHSCLGRAVAMNDMMLIAARLLRQYSVRFPPGETGDAVWNDWKDQFTSNPGRLRLIFESRKD